MEKPAFSYCLRKAGSNKYHEVYFSVLHHPENHFLTQSMDKYRKLINNSSKFGSFTSLDLIDATSLDMSLKDWIVWYDEVYFGDKKY